ncbi:hypothetical protein L0244_31715, partial [bacterium]|nr:hypothetical protein [bacterium]
ELKNRRVKVEIVEFTTDRPKLGRRGSPAIPSGTKLFALKYIGKDGYYTYSYLNREDAENCIEGSKLYQTDNEFYYHWNMVMNIQDTLHYGESK